MRLYQQVENCCREVHTERGDYVTASAWRDHLGAGRWKHVALQQVLEATAQYIAVRSELHLSSLSGQDRTRRYR